MSLYRTMIYVLLLSTVALTYVSGHGRLIEPPSRNSAWRYGFDTLRDKDDHGRSIWCGGRGNSNDGKDCGVCGDPINGTRNNEVGGKFFTGKVVRYYQKGQVIDIKVNLTAPHRRSFWEFKICPSTNDSEEVTQECLDSNILNIQEHGQRFIMPLQNRTFSLKVKLPDNLLCDRCVLQWTWHSGGTKEMFRACADIWIGLSSPASTCQNKDDTCRGYHGTQGNCCDGFYCHRPLKSSTSGVCYKR